MVKEDRTITIIVLDKIECPFCGENDQNHILLKRTGERIFEKDIKIGLLFCTSCHDHFIYLPDLWE